MRTRFSILAAAGIAALALASAALAFPPKQANPLGLTPAQKQKLLTLNQKARAEISAVQFGLGKKEEKGARVEKLQRKYDEAGLAVLTPTQRVQVEAARQARARKMAQVMAVQKTLTPDQKAKAKRIRADFSAKAQTILRNKKTTVAEKRMQYIALQRQMGVAELAILTSKQRAALPK